MSTVLNKIKYDHLSPEDIQELVGYDQLCLLSELAKDIGRLTDLACDAVDAKREAQELCIDNPSPENKKLLNKSSATLAKCQLWLKARRDQHRSLQSNLKAGK